MKKLICLIITLAAIVPPAAFAAAPLANEHKDGLYVNSLEQVLRLPPEELDIATAALIVSERWSDIVQGLAYLDRLDAMAYEIRDILQRRNIPVNHRAIPVINEYLYVQEGFSSVKEATNPDDLFLHTVMDKKQGYCLSLSILYLSLGERLGLPLYGVVVPGHFFVRYDDGRVRFNIETTHSGSAAPDKHYVEKFNVPQHLDTGIYMKNLNKRRALGCLFNNLGNVYSQIGDKDTAQEILEKAVDINPSLAESQMNLANIYLEKGRIDRAIRHYHAALDINPDDPKSHLNLGNAYSDKGWLEQAVNEYKTCINLDPDIMDAYKNLANIYTRQGNLEQARSPLLEALSIQPENASLLSRLGDVYMRMGNCEKAMSLYNNALELQPDLAEAYYGIGMCRHKQGYPEKEIQAFRKALSLNPRMVGAMVNLANAYADKEDYSAAIPLYRQATRIRPDDTTVLYNYGSACSNMGDFQKAAQLFEKTLDIDNNLAAAHNALAYVYYRLNEYEAAYEHIVKAEELGAQIDHRILSAIQKELQ